MVNEKVLIAAAICLGFRDAQSKQPGIALPARLWLLSGANGWLDELDIYHGVIRQVKRLDPLPQASFYEMAWDDWQPEPMAMACPTPEVGWEPEPDPVELEPEPESGPVLLSVTDVMVARVGEWAAMRGS